MSVSPGTIVPPAVVLAVAGWACWSALGPATAQKPKPKPIESAAALLSPEFGATAGRDPFALPGESEPVARAAVAGPARGKDESRPESPLQARFRQLLTDLGTRLAAARDAETKRAEAREALSRLPLAATSIHGGRRAAIIDGRAYVEGEAIEGTDPELGPVILAEVRAREVVVRSAAGPVVVRFADGASHLASARSASAPPGPAEAPPAAKDARPKRGRPSSGVVTVRGKTR